MPKSLENQFISDHYTSLLHLERETLDTERDYIYDGLGNQTAISISNNGNTIEINKLEMPKSSEFTTLTGFFIDLLFPVGSIYLTTSTISPSAQFFGTVWENVSKGRVVVGVGELESKTFNAENNIGEYSHTISIDQIPKHSHAFANTDYPYAVTWHSEGTISRQEAGSKDNKSYSFPGSKPIAQSIAEEGGGEPFDSTPPTYGVYVWKRIS